MATTLARFGRRAPGKALGSDEPQRSARRAGRHPRGAFLTVKSALASLQASGSDALVNIGGVGGHTGAKQRAHVVTARAGLVGFTRALAHELAANQITVNCVAPGLIDTGRDPNLPLPQHHRCNRSLLGRLGDAAAIAAAVRSCVAPARSITGEAARPRQPLSCLIAARASIVTGRPRAVSLPPGNSRAA